MIKNKKILSDIKQFFSYFAVGGIAALVEWLTFFLLDLLHCPYLAATAAAFILATFVNFFLGRTFTFSGSTYGNKKKELAMVFLVSAIGLGFNMLLMFVAVSLLGLNSTFLKTASKIVCTGIVFFWNFFARKLWIYKKKT